MRGDGAHGAVPAPPRAPWLGTINAQVAPLWLRAAARAIAWRQLELRAHGLHHLPAAGPVLLAVRHFHHLHDGVALLAALPRRVHVLVALDWVDRALLRWAMEWATRTARWPTILRPDALAARGRDGLRPSVYGTADVERLQRRAVRDSVDVLSGGGALAVFPEGYPNIDPGFTPKRATDQVLPFRAGFIHLAAVAQRRLRRPIPIVPIGLEYAAGPCWRVTLRCGAPLALGPDRPALLQAVQEQVTRLSGVATAAA